MQGRRLGSSKAMPSEQGPILLLAFGHEHPLQMSWRDYWHSSLALHLSLTIKQMSHISVFRWLPDKNTMHDYLLHILHTKSIAALFSTLCTIPAHPQVMAPFRGIQPISYCFYGMSQPSA